MYDVIIVGGGPAGLSAAIYTARRALNTLVLTQDIGGQIAKSNLIENYPGFDRIKGADLAMKMKSQAETFGAKIIYTQVKKIEKKDNFFTIQTQDKTYEARTIILASGKQPRELGIPEEERLKGKGITYCATCDVPLFKNKIVAVAGGGNSALDAALLASKYAREVYIIHRSQFSGEQILIDKIKKDPKITVILDSTIEKITGKDYVESIQLSNKKELRVDAVIVEIGFTINQTLFEKLIKTDKKNQVIINANQETSMPGIFAAGDITNTPYKQVIISAGEGAKAALSCFDFLQKAQGKKGIRADWH